MNKNTTLLGCLIVVLGTLAGCGKSPESPDGKAQNNPYPSTYVGYGSKPTLITNANILTGNGEQIEAGAILLRDGKIHAIGKDVSAPKDTLVIDAGGKWVTPGIIDVHSHMGVYPTPAIKAHSDGNEMVDPVTADVWAEHSVWPQDPQFATALAGGVTSLMVLPGSANLIGGRAVVLKNVPGRTVQEMKFPNAPHSLKMACGENPKRVYGGKEKAPMTRMGNMAGYRNAWIQAKEYQDKWKRYEKKKQKDPDAEPPKRDLKMETLVGALEGKLLVHMHCYRADEMALILDLAKEFGYKVTAFHHAVEAYKIADLLAASGTCAAMWADWWGFKIEAFDAVRENVAMVDKAGACAIVHSDSGVWIQRLNQEAAKIMAAANRNGAQITRAQAIRWLTINAAKALGIDSVTGSLEKGKMADLVIWDGDPFSVYSHAEKVFVDGALLYDRADPNLQPHTDFELGISTIGGQRS